MTRYFDLLRAHQQDKPSPNVQPSPLHSDVLEDDSSTLPDETNEIIHEVPVIPDETEQLLLVDEESSSKPDDALMTDHHTDTTTSATEEVHEPPSDNTQHSPNFDDHSQWMLTCTQRIQRIFEHAQNQQSCSIEPLSQHLHILIEHLENDSDQRMIDALELSIAQQTHHIRGLHPSLGSLIQKSIMMMLYAIKAGQRLQLTFDDLINHTLAAMLHHIGMAQISPDIRHKKERLNKRELKSIQQAPQLGHAFLALCHIEEPCILQAALQSNERYDGSGAMAISGSDIAWSARLTGVLSMFESLIHYRPYRNRLLPRDAIREIVKHHKQAFDPEMLKALIESISLYPIGTYAQLNSGDIGLVIHIHPYRPLRPVVEIRMDRSGNPIPPRQIDLTTQPNLTVERCMYEEGTLELAKQTKPHGHQHG